MTYTRRLAALALAVALGVAACNDHEFHPRSEAERVEQAEAMYEAANFDTVTWASDSARIATGNLVFADECRRCHGPLGRGDTDYARERELDVPSLVEPDWPLAGSVDTVRWQIFVGHGAGMPEWGVGRLTPREIDAAATYVVQQLRPEILSDTIPVPAPLETDSQP